MIWIARIGVGLVFLLSLGLGLFTLVTPDAAGEFLGITEQSGVGRATVRGDIAALFLTSAIGCGGALFAGKRKWLLAPLALYSIVLLGRLIELAVAGPAIGAYTPIIVEITMIAALLLGLRTFRRT